MLQKANDVLYYAVKGISDVIVGDGLINLDFADVRTTMSEAGLALMGTGIASGENRAREAAQRAIMSPLLEDVSLESAKAVPVSYTHLDVYKRQVLLNLKYEISGSDMSDSAVVRHLRSLGARIAVGHAAENVGDVQVLVKSTAISDDNPELVEARKRNIAIIPRAEMLAELMRLRQGIAIAGTHGKTTVSYTHLDVYKRQSILRATRALRGICWFPICPAWVRSPFFVLPLWARGWVSYGLTPIRLRSSWGMWDPCPSVECLVILPCCASRNWCLLW